MPNIRFARFLIIESLLAGQYRSGHHLFETLQPLLRERGVPVGLDYVAISSRTELESLLPEIRKEAIRTDGIPLLHVECHGNDSGIELANGDFITWEDLCQLLTPLNILTRLNLFISIAACFGAHFASQLVPTQRAPFSACLSVTKEAQPDEIYRGFRDFYVTLLSTLDGNAALKQLGVINKQGSSFYLSEATDFFKLAWRAYLGKYCTPEKYTQRAQYIREDLIEQGKPAPSVEEIRGRLVASEGPAFDRFRELYFMADIFPDNAMRFPVSSEDVARERPPT